MPRIHAYGDGSGHYIKSASGGSIVTYQVTPLGEDYLRTEWLGDGSRISQRKLLKMEREGLVFSGEAGPGERAAPGCRRRSCSCCACCSSAFVIGAVVLAALPLVARARRASRKRVQEKEQARVK